MLADDFLQPGFKGALVEGLLRWSRWGWPAAIPGPLDRACNLLTVVVEAAGAHDPITNLDLVEDAYRMLACEANRVIPKRDDAAVTTKTRMVSLGFLSHGAG